MQSQGNRSGIGVRCVVLAALVLVAAACGNSDSSASDPTTTGPANTDGSSVTTGENVPVDAPGVTDTEIRVGGVASVDNPLGGKYGDSFAGVRAYFDMVNEAGGVHGRKLVLAAERDDKVANNSAEVEGLLSQDDVFAVLPVATLLFTGAQKLVDEAVPTFGWTINPEWEGTVEEPRANLFGQSGSVLCFDCPAPFVPWLAGQDGATKVGLLAYQVPQSSECADGIQASFGEFGERVGAEVAYTDQSLAYGAADLSVQVSKMKQAGVDFVITCMDNQGVVTLAKEMKKQKLDAPQYMPNSYDQDFLDEFGDLFEGSYVRTDFVQWEIPEDEHPEGLRNYLTWIEKQDVEPSENGIVGWINADLFVTGLREAGPDFDRAKLVAAINGITDYDAAGLIRDTDWTRAHTDPPDTDDNCQFISQIQDGAFVPVFSEPGKPFVCPVVTDDALDTRNSD